MVHMRQNTPNTPIIKDWFLLGMTTGAINSLGKKALSAVLKKAGIRSIDYSAIAEKLLTNGRLKGKATTTTGTLADIVIGGLFGVALTRIYATTPPGSETIKGALGGGLIWGVSLIAGTRTGLIEKVTPSEMIATLAMDVAFGAGLGAVVGRYQARAITQSHPILVREVTKDEFNTGRLSTSGGTAASQHAT